jgi:ketosteroid isomerase-like protein
LTGASIFNVLNFINAFPGDDPMMTPTELAEQFLKLFGSGDLDGIAAQMASNVVIKVQGSPEVPWTGIRKGPTGAKDFLQKITSLLTPKAFAVYGIVADEKEAYVHGAFEMTVNSTDRSFKSDFVMRITAREGQITGYEIFEDSFAIERGFVGSH